MEDDETTSILRGILSKFYEAKLLSDGYYASLLSHLWDAKFYPDQFANDFVNAVQYVDIYKLLERIERGEELIAGEADPVKRQGYEQFRRRLVAQLDKLQASP